MLATRFNRTAKQRALPHMPITSLYRPRVNPYSAKSLVRWKNVILFWKGGSFRNYHPVRKVVFHCTAIQNKAARKRSSHLAQNHILLLLPYYFACFNTIFGSANGSMLKNTLKHTSVLFWKPHQRLVRKLEFIPFLQSFALSCVFCFMHAAMGTPHKHVSNLN